MRQFADQHAAGVPHEQQPQVRIRGEDLGHPTRDGAVERRGRGRLDVEHAGAGLQVRAAGGGVGPEHGRDRPEPFHDGFADDGRARRLELRPHPGAGAVLEPGMLPALPTRVDGAARGLLEPAGDMRAERTGAAQGVDARIVDRHPRRVHRRLVRHRLGDEHDVGRPLLRAVADRHDAEDGVGAAEVAREEVREGPVLVDVPDAAQQGQADRAVRRELDKDGPQVRVGREQVDGSLRGDVGHIDPVWPAATGRPVAARSTRSTLAGRIAV